MLLRFWGFGSAGQGGASDWETFLGVVNQGSCILECVGGFWDIDVIVVMGWVEFG